MMRIILICTINLIQPVYYLGKMMKVFFTYITLIVPIFLTKSLAFAHTPHSEQVSHFHNIYHVFDGSVNLISLVVVLSVSVAALVYFNIKKVRVYFRDL